VAVLAIRPGRPGLLKFRPGLNKYISDHPGCWPLAKNKRKTMTTLKDARQIKMMLTVNASYQSLLVKCLVCRA
jgi:hypothetical protein